MAFENEDKRNIASSGGQPRRGRNEIFCARGDSESEKSVDQNFLNTCTGTPLGILYSLLVTVEENFLRVTWKRQSYGSFPLPTKFCVRCSLCLQVSTLTAMKRAETSKKVFVLANFRRFQTRR